MKRTTLETLLRARLADSRAMIGSLDINHDRVLLHFGAIGELPRITLSISDNETSIALPDVLAVEWRLGDEAKRSRTPLDPGVPLKATLIDGALRIGKDGPEVILLANDGETRLGVSLPGAEAGESQTGEFASFPVGDPIAAAFDGERLTAGDGGPEIVLPEAFYGYVASALLTGEVDEADPGAAEGATGAETGADGANGGLVPEPHTDKVATQPLAATEAPASDGKWIDFDKVKLDDLKALAAAEGAELGMADNTRREIAAKINAKRGAVGPAAK